MLHTTTRAKKNLVNNNELDYCARVRINFLQNNHDRSWEFPGLFSLFLWPRCLLRFFPGRDILPLRFQYTLLYFGSQKTGFVSPASDLTTSKRVIGAPELVRWEGIIVISTSVKLGQLNLISYGRTGIWEDLSQVDHMSFRVVKSLWVAKRRASDEVPRGLMNVRRLMNKQDEGLFWKSRIWVSCFEAAKRPGKIPSL